MPPRNAHCAWSQPLENDHRPDSWKPPGSRATLPVGAYDDEISVVRSWPHTSSWASSGNSASCQAWTPSTPSTQALEAQAAPTLICTS